MKAKVVVTGSWFDIDWKFVYQKVYHMQVQIRVAWKNNDKAKAKILQHDLVNSWVGRAMAVRIVATNQKRVTIPLE